MMTEESETEVSFIDSQRRPCSGRPLCRLIGEIYESDILYIVCTGVLESCDMRVSMGYALLWITARARSLIRWAN